RRSLSSRQSAVCGRLASGSGGLAPRRCGRLCSNRVGWEAGSE
ncbi:uncharacterized protein METZ01_LOCUS313238, partial [marine metagenome]